MLNKKSLQSTLACLAAKQLEQSRRAYAEYLAGAARDSSEVADHHQASQEFGNAEIAEYFEGPARSYEANLERLRAIDFGPKDSVEEGAAARIDGRWFVIGVATQAFACEGESYMGISTEAPIYAALAGARAGDVVKFRGRELLVESVG
jgi:transcription elongation GreA/GreB family factor